MKFVTKLEKVMEEQGKKWSWLQNKLGFKSRKTLIERRKNNSFTESEKAICKKELNFN